MKFKLGADPELWIFDNKLGKIISAHGLFPGTKEEPYKVEHGAIQVDGMAAEYNIHPATNKEEFIFFNISVLRSLRDEIKKRNPDLDFSFKFQPVADFGEEYISSQPPEARMLGCTPDFNAWQDGATNPTPDADMPFRTASGHIHLGWSDEDIDITDPEHIEACCMMVKSLDATVAPMFVAMEGKEGHRRRELYGKAGAFRPKKYGVEYRTLSNMWLNNTNYMGKVFSYSKVAFNDLLGGYKSYESKIALKTVEKINSGETSYLIEYYGAMQPYYDDYNDEVTVDTLDKLYEKFEVKAKNVEGNVLVDNPFFVDDEDDIDEDDFDIIDDVV